MSVEFEFSVGPVQAFVAQARRTGDFWGGSYLLSFLTAHAIRGALGVAAKVSPAEFVKIRSCVGHVVSGRERR